MLDGTALDPRQLRDAFGRFATGVTVVTMLDDEGRPTGVTVNSFSSVSLTPALCLFSLGKEQVSCRWLRDGSHFTVNILAAHQEDIAWGFARPRDDKFEGVPRGDGSFGVPYIDGSLCHFECRFWAKYDGGDHDIIVGEVLNFQELGGEPMLFYKGAIAALPE